MLLHRPAALTKSHLVGRLAHPHLASLFVLAIFLTLQAHAQDAHYWNLFYGTEATLLGGTVIGSASDLSATYYNPGMLAVNKEKGLLLGANIYSYQRYTVKGYGAKDVIQGRLAPAPGLIAGRIPLDSTSIGGIAYSILTRQSIDATLEGRFVGQRDVLGNDGAAESFSSDLTLGASLSDTWVGATIFRLLDPSVGFGVTTYAAVRTQKTRSTAIGDALGSDGTTFGSTSRIADVNYTNVRLLWKLGVGVNLDPFTFGLTVTTPSVNLFGTGSVLISYSRLVSDTTQKPILLANNQEDLASLYKTSWAIGIGMGYRFGEMRVHFSAEWYAAVPQFTVLETTTFTGQSDGMVHSSVITDERRSVVNAGVGLQYAISPVVAVYGSVVTDFSYVLPGTSSNLSLSPWDLLHISFGTVLSFRTVDITAGLSFAGGHAPLKDIPWTNFSASLGQIIGTNSNSNIGYFSATGVLAFTFKL